MKRRRNAPLTDAQAAALRSILAAHGSAVANPKRRRAVKRTAKRRHAVKRRISASLRRKLLANLRKARRARWSRRSRR